MAPPGDIGSVSKAPHEPGVLYVVATPIGNLADITRRAVDVLGQVDRIAAEDTRHTRALLTHLGIRGRLVSLHEHNEEARAQAVLARLLAGESVALVSDAGTPLVSDPGYRLVRAARRAGVRVSPVPGASSILAALSVAGLPTDRFAFEGFLPSRAAPRRERLRALATEPRTLVLLESSHRIAATLADMAAILGAEREAVVARELTKTFETVRLDSLGGLAAWVEAEARQRRGEFVVLLRGAEPEHDDEAADTEALRVLDLLLAELPVRQAAALAARITGRPRNGLYKLALERKGR